jgi:starch phosphorylase
MRGRIDRPSTNCLGGDSGVVESWPSVRVEHVEFSGVGDAAEVGALLSVRAFVSLGELTPDDVHVQVLHGKIDSNDVLTGVTVQDLDPAESYDGGRYRFDGPIVSTAATPSATPCG